MAIKTSAVTTRALRRKEFFQWPPIVLPHTFTTLTSKMASSIISSVVSVLIGHVFSVSAKNMNSSFFRTWIALLLDFFPRGHCVCEVCLVVFGFIFVFRADLFYSARHVLSVMAARPCTTFVHTKTIRLIVEEGMDINAIEIVRSPPDFKEEITGIVPNFGGKCFEIMLRSTDAATRLAMSRFDYGTERKPLKLLGARTIHILVFVAMGYPDQDIVNFLQQYGQLKSENLRRLFYTEEGFTSIERGIRVAEFTSLDRDLPRKVVTQGLEIFFKYTSQPITCYRCRSTENVVKNCPKQHSRFNHIRVEDRVLSAPLSLSV